MNLYAAYSHTLLLLNPTRQLALMSPCSKPPIRVLNDSLASSAAKAAPLLGNLGTVGKVLHVRSTPPASNSHKGRFSLGFPSIRPSDNRKLKSSAPDPTC